MDNLGHPVAYLVVPEDAPVYAGGEQVGHVAQVLADEGADIFHGLVVELTGIPARHRFADPSQLAGLYERGVVLAVRPDELRDPSDDAVAARAVGNDPVREGLRRAVDWLKR